MVESQPSKHGVVRGQTVSGPADAFSDSENLEAACSVVGMVEANYSTDGLLEAIGLLPESVKQEILKRLPRKKTMLLSRSHHAEAKAPSKKLKPSQTSGDGLLELDGAAQGSSTTTGESNQLVSRWTCYRMLIPVECNDSSDLAEINKIREEKKVQIDLYPKDGFGIVTISAEEDFSPMSPAFEGFIMVQEYFLDKHNYFPPQAAFRLTRLLVPAAQARELFHHNTFKIIAEGTGCYFNVYLTDIVSILSFGDVIVELQGLPERVIAAVCEIAFYLRLFAVDESVISELDSHGGIPANNETSASGGESNRTFHGVKVDRRSEGENIKEIQKATSTTIFIAPGDRDGVRFHIYGDDDSDIEEAEKLLEGYIGEKGVFDNVFKCYIYKNYIQRPGSPVVEEDSD